MQHDFAGGFDARRNGMTLSNMVVRVGNSKLVLEASLQNYSQPTAHANYGLTLDAAGHLRNSDGRIPQRAAGVIGQVDGTADYASAGNGPLLATVSLDGNVKSSALAVRTPTLRTTIRDLSAHYHLANGNADLQNFRTLLGSSRYCSAAKPRCKTSPAQSCTGHAVVAMRGISLADL